MNRVALDHRRQPRHRRRDRAARRRARLRGVRQLPAQRDAAEAVVRTHRRRGGARGRGCAPTSRSRPTSCGCSRPATQRSGRLDGAGQQRRHPRAADARRRDGRRAPAARLRHQRDRRVPVRARGGAADVDPARRARRRDRQRLVRRLAARLARRIRRLRGLEGRDRHDDDRPGAGGRRGRHPRERGARRVHLHRDPRQRRRAGPRRPRQGARADEARRARPRKWRSAILWLLSDEASYTTGAFIDVAGGK